jgi:hypothetical protein
MASRVFLHIGAPKSGTTYLQTKLGANKDAVRAQGVLLPDRLDVIRLMRWVTGREAERPRPSRAGRGWDDVLAAIREWPDTAVISHEMLCTATREQAVAALAAFGPADVHLVYTLRDLARTLPSEWQQAVRGGHSGTFDDYVRAVRQRSADDFGFVSRHDVVDVLSRWAGNVDPSRVHLVTLPPPGADRGLLWSRFSTVIGIDADSCTEPERWANDSLGSVEAEVLRRFNIALQERMVDERLPVSWTRRNVANGILIHRPDQRRFTIRPADLAWVRARAEETVAAVGGAGYDIVGELADLVPGDVQTSSVHPDDLPAADISSAAVELAAALAAALREADR